MNPDEIPEYESHPFYPTRFFRWAIRYSVPDQKYLPKLLQQKWRNISGDEEWRDIPEVLIEPNVTVEEIADAPEPHIALQLSDLPEHNQTLNDKNLITLHTHPHFYR